MVATIFVLFIFFLFSVLFIQGMPHCLLKR